MMKIIQSILGVIGVIVIIFMIDLFCISDKRKPIVYFKNSYEQDHYYYKGLLYDVYDCNGVNVESGTHIVFKGKEFKCKNKYVEEIKQLKVESIIDLTIKDEDFKCEGNKEVLFQDSTNVYYFDCPKSTYVKVYYEDGSSDNIKTAIGKGLVSISDLDKFEIKYLKEAKSEK